MRPRLVTRLDGFLFAPVDQSAVALFRTLFSAYLAVLFWPHIREVTGAFLEYERIVALYDQVFLAPWYGVAIALPLVAFGASRWPRVSGLLLILLLMPLVATSRFSLSRQVALTGLVALWLVPGPARHGGTTPEAPIWPIRLIQIELAAVYGWNAIAKATPDFLSGRVLTEMSTTYSNFLIDLSDGYVHVGVVFLPVWLCAWAIVLIEAALAVGFWFRRTRWATAFLGVGFHVLLMWIVEIGFLDWSTMFLYLAFLLPFESHREPHPASKTLIYDGDCSLCRWISEALGRLGVADAEHRRAYQSFEPALAAQMDTAGIRNEMLVREDQSGELRSGVGGFLWLLRDAYPRLAILLGLAPVHWLLTLGYRIIAYNRRELAPPRSGVVCACDPDPHAGYRAFLYLLMALLHLLTAVVVGVATLNSMGAYQGLAMALYALAWPAAVLLARIASGLPAGWLVMQTSLALSVGSLIALPILALSLLTSGGSSQALVGGALLLGLAAFRRSVYRRVIRPD